MRPRNLALGQLVLIALLGSVFTGSAYGHAQLTGSSPAANELLMHAPRTIELRFGEDVEAQFGAIALYGPDGTRIPVGKVQHPANEASSIRTSVLGRGSAGAWTAVFRVVSADGHPVSGGVVFDVGSRGSAAKSVSELAAPVATPKLVDGALGLGRAGGFIALALGLGSVLMFTAVVRRLAWTDGLGAEVAVRLVLVGAAVGVVSGLLGIWGQTAVAGGTSLVEALNWTALNSTLHTRYGEVTGLAILCWLAVAAFVGPSIRSLRAQAILPLSASLGLLAAVPALGGHAATQQPIGLFASLNVLHVIAMSFWSGGVITLIALASASRQQGSRQLTVVRVAITRFSPLALWAVALVVASGVGQSLINIDSFAQLVKTPYGRAVLVKVLLTLCLISVGGWQRRRGIPAIEREGAESTYRIRRALLTETALFTGVLAATAALASYSPASVAVSGGVVSRSATSGPVNFQLTVDPARVGVNQIHLYLLDAETGAQMAGVKQVSVSEEQAAKGIGPLSQVPRRVGPGHWIVPTASLPVGGEWTVRVVARISEFDQYEQSFSVPVH